jgi:hypothetical protein
MTIIVEVMDRAPRVPTVRHGRVDDTTTLILIVVWFSPEVTSSWV